MAYNTTVVGIVSMLRKGVLQCLVSANYLLYNVVVKKRLFNTEIYMSMVFWFLRVSHNVMFQSFIVKRMMTLETVYIYQ